MTDPSFTEKRAHPRFPIKIDLNYFNSNDQQSIAAQTLDISVEGLCILTLEPLTVGSYLEVSLEILGNGKEILKKAKVVWTSTLASGKYCAGLKLEEQKIAPIPIVLKTILARKIHP